MQLGIISIIALAASLLSVVELGMTSYLSSEVIGDAPSQISFMIFSSVWSIVVLGYFVLCPMYMAQFYNKLVSLVLNAITMLFWFAGSIALAVLFRHCGAGAYCGTGKAAIVFGFLLWLGFSGLTVMEGLDWTKNRSSSGVAGLKAPNAYPGA